MDGPIATLSDFGVFVPGEEVGVSSWFLVTQQMVSSFGDATLDLDPIHIDPEWARNHTSYGGTIAYGFFTMSLLTHFLHDALGTSSSRSPTEHGYFMNYGFDSLRLVSPVPVGSRVRARFRTLENRADEKGRSVVKLACEMEIEGEDRPALVAAWLAIWIPTSTQDR